MSTLNKIAQSHGTDKSSDIHNYCVKYQKYLPFNRYDNLNILEIGVLNGKSLKTWKDFYYRSNIIGIDIEPTAVQYAEENISIEIGSQADGKFLNDVGTKYSSFDMILDDGSHLNSHVIFSFEHLFGFLKSGGVYVVEDTCTAYWEEYEGGYLKPTTSVEYFKKLSDDVSFRGLMNFNSPNVHARREDWLIDLSKQTQPDCRTDIESITFMNGIILINKK
jgi:hypothetical protein